MQIVKFRMSTNVIFYNCSHATRGATRSVTLRWTRRDFRHRASRCATFGMLQKDKNAKQCHYTVLEGARTCSCPTALHRLVYDTVKSPDLLLNLWMLWSTQLLLTLWVLGRSQLLLTLAHPVPPSSPTALYTANTC